MSLNWNLEDIKDYETVCFVRREPQPNEGNFEVDEDGKARYLAPLTEALIFTTMSVKIGVITEENVGEFYARVKMIESISGALTYKIEDGVKTDQFVTPEQIKAHIGLRCNVIEEDREAFFGTISYYLDDNLREFNRATREEVTA